MLNIKTFQEQWLSGTVGLPKAGKLQAFFIDAGDFEKLKRQGDVSIKNWIDNQLRGTSVTVVLVGKYTCISRWVKYEIEKSIQLGNGLLGVDISKLCGKIPDGYPFYLWNKDDGYNNMGDWIEKAAKQAGR